MITIKNEELEFTVNPYGAEGVSLRDVKTGHEYWWHGDPAYWEAVSYTHLTLPTIA